MPYMAIKSNRCRVQNEKEEKLCAQKEIWYKRYRIKSKK
jgi:hypothetical protein